MKTLIKATVVTLVLSFTTLYAGDTHSHSHEGHNHSQEGHGHSHRYDALKSEVSKTAVEKAAIQEVKRLVLKKKIPKSWKSMPISKIGKTHYGDTNDWAVAFKNLKIKDKTKQTLYIFVSVRGNITGANYTGK
jgi:hypothetical protein